MNNYLTPKRFDLIPKYLYVKYNDLNLTTDFYKKLYDDHILTFNGGWEYPGNIKKNINDFKLNFDKIIKFIKNKKFNDNSPQIPIGKNNIIINGSHRLATCLYYNINNYPINFKSNNGVEIYNYNFFRNRKEYFNDKRRPSFIEIKNSMDEIYLDTVALEYIKLKKNIIPIIIYPCAKNKTKEIETIFKKYGYIYYYKEVKFNKIGLKNLIRECYRGEKWIGGFFANGGHIKLEKCYQKNNPLRLYLLETNGNLVKMKEKIRNIFKLDKHSCHIPDTYIDGLRISKTLLNKNTINYMNLIDLQLTKENKKLLKLFYKLVNSTKNSEYYCIDSSFILSMYNLREAKDLDYLSYLNNILSIKTGIENHNDWAHYYRLTKDDIIFNPKNHFYFAGLKFTTLSSVKNMKIRRNQDKDKIDVKLIKKILF